MRTSERYVIVAKEFMQSLAGIAVIAGVPVILTAVCAFISLLFFIGAGS